MTPDLDEIAAVTDYIVSYACKGNEQASAVTKNLKRFVINFGKETLSEMTPTTLSRKILNNALKSRLVPKQEAVVHLANLPLCTCSETIERVSLSSGYKLSSEIRTTSNIVSKYARRLKTCRGNATSLLKEMSLDDYFHHIKNQNNNGKVIIPHYYGAKSTPCYPISLSYARYVYPCSHFRDELFSILK
jgi:hypothetical protein